MIREPKRSEICRRAGRGTADYKAQVSGIMLSAPTRRRLEALAVLRQPSP